MANLPRILNRMVDRMWTESPWEIQETEGHYLMTFDFPDIKKDDVKVVLAKDVHTVSGEGKNQSFYRSFWIPAGTKPEQIEAHYADGVLRVANPKTEAAKAQQIKVSEGKSRFWDRLLGRSEQRTSVKIVV